jgi:hypothetical protein
LAVGVIVKVTIIGALVVLVKLPLMFPVPLAAIPVTKALLSLVQLKAVEVTLLERAIAAIAFVEQMVCVEFVATTLGVGCTKTVVVIGVPIQELAVGVMVKVTVTGAFVVLIKLPLMFPLPVAAIPVTVALLSLVQLKAVEVTFPERAIVAIAFVEHIVCAVFVATTLGVGFTKTVVVIGAPVQELAVGVMVKVTIIGAFVELVKLPLMFPVPLAAIPVTAALLFLVQLKVVEVTLPERAIVAIAFVEQMVCVELVATTLGIGFTKTVVVIGVPAHELAVGVMVKVTVIGSFVVLIKLPLMFPLPVAVIPVTVALLSLIQL